MLKIPERFSKNQLDYLSKCKESWLNIVEGGKRAGKNIVNVMAFCDALETSPSYVNLIAGVDQAIAKINIMECDGFGVLNYFYGRIKAGKFQGKDAYYVSTKVGKRVIIAAGGSKISDAKDIKGLTIACAYITEANECHYSFVDEVITRTNSFPMRRKIFMDLNPKAPTHWFYKFMDFHKKQQSQDKSYGFNYGHFTMADNMSLSDDDIRMIIKTYDKESILYKRDIKGESIAVEGVVFKQFAEHTKDYLVKKADVKKNDIIEIAVGVDFGGTGSQHTFVARAYTKSYKKVIFLKSQKVMALGVTPVELANKFCDFVEYIYKEYGIVHDDYGNEKYILIQSFCDSAEQTLINGLRIANDDRRLYNEIHNAKKIKINDRIRALCGLMAQHRVELVEEETQTLQEAWCNALWDKKAADEGEDVRLDDGTSDIDTCDAAEYTIERDIDLLQIYS